MNNLQELRDQLLTKRVIQQQAKANTEKAVENLKALIADFIAKYNEYVYKFNIDVSFMNDINYDWLKEDQTYLDSVIARFNETEQLLQSKLEEILNV